MRIFTFTNIYDQQSLFIFSVSSYFLETTWVLHILERIKPALY